MDNKMQVKDSNEVTSNGVISDEKACVSKENQNTVPFAKR